MNIILMAGGGGTRLWPLSRRTLPKQFLSLGGKKTLLEQTYDRARALVPVDHIFVATVPEYGSKVRSLLPEVLPANIFYEPERRDNAAAFINVALRLIEQGKGNDIAVHMWSDHIFTAEGDYLKDVQKIPTILASQPEGIAVVGHVASSPETGLGYIEAGEAVAGFDDVFKVTRFKEKPDLETAKQYVAAGNFFWNIGAVSLRPLYLLQAVAAASPDFVPGIAALKEALTTGGEDHIAAAYHGLPKLSIDYALLEKAAQIFVVTGDYGWSDIGNWSVVQEIFGRAGDHVPAGHHIHVDSQDNYVYNATSKAVSLIGVKNTIVVITNDAVLITDKASTHKVKEVVAQLEEAGKAEYL